MNGQACSDSTPSSDTGSDKYPNKWAIGIRNGINCYAIIMLVKGLNKKYYSMASGKNY